jgi:hypothetical protein
MVEAIRDQWVIVGGIVLLVVIVAWLIRGRLSGRSSRR